MSTNREAAPAFSGRSNKEAVTPHRLTVALLIREFFKFRNDQEGNPESCPKKLVRDFCLLALDLVQSPDLTLEELRSVLMTALPQAAMLRDFEETLAQLDSDGISRLFGLMSDVGKLVMREAENVVVVTPATTMMPKTQINRNSVVGYYLRRLLLNFDALTFSEVTAALSAFKEYYNHTPVVIADIPVDEVNVESISGECSIQHKIAILQRDDWSSQRNQWSRRQADLFIASQAAYLASGDEKAFEPSELKEHMRNVLKSNPDLAEAHFLNYLNYLRVNEFCGAIKSLYHSFDRSAILEGKGSNSSSTTSDDKNRTFRFACLNLAILHFKFGHREEAFAALKESIMLAQEANDELCLQHSLSWLYCLANIDKDKLLQHSILKSLDFNYPDIVSLGIESFVEYAGVHGGTPKYIFETLARSDIINSQHSFTNRICINYIQKAALWLFYGKSDMSSLCTQLLLYLNSESGMYGKISYGESICQAMCNLANQFLLQGEYSHCLSILLVTRERFPHEPLSHIWSLCDDLFTFVRALHHENWLEAETAAHRMAVYDVHESKLRLAELYVCKRDYSAAATCVKEVLGWAAKTAAEAVKERGGGTCRRSDFKLRMDYYVRAKILLAETQYLSSYPNVVMPDLLTVMLGATIDFYLDYYQSITYLHMAYVLLLTGMPAQALKVLDRCIVQILAHGGQYDRGRAMLLYAKCLVANSRHMEEVERRKNVLNACDILCDVRRNFNAVEAFSRVRDVLYLQAHLYNELKMPNKRNKCALEFRTLNEEHAFKSDSLGIAL